MTLNISNRNFYKDTRNNFKKNQELSSDETALRDEILELKRQVMVLRRTNEQNLVKFRKYENEAKRKDREIEQLMDPRKNADVTKVLSTKGAAILMTLKDQNNALIQMVLNKDVQIRRLLAEMKMSKLYASTRKNVSYKDEIIRLQNLLTKSQEKLKENLEKENQVKAMCEHESLFFEFSSPSGQSSPRDLDELRLVVRSLEAHLKYSTDLLNKKDQEISVLTDQLSFLKKLLKHKASKNESFDIQPTDFPKYSSSNNYLASQIKDPDIIRQSTKLSGAEILAIFEKSTNFENKIVSSSAPASSTRQPSSKGDFMSKHKSLLSITGNDCKDSKTESVKLTKAESTFLQEAAAREDSNEANIICKNEKVRDRNVLNKYKKPKKKIPKKFSRSAKKKKFCEKEKKISYIPVLERFESKKKEMKVNDVMVTEVCAISDSKENKIDPNTEIFSKSENSGFDKDETVMSTTETEEFKEIPGGRSSSMVDCDLHYVDKDPETPKSDKNSIMDNLSGCSSEIVGINLPSKQEDSKIRNEETKSFNFQRKIYRESFDSSFESENSYSMKQQVQQVQVEVQIDSISAQDDGDELENSVWENNHSEEFTESRKGDCTPDDNDDNNDDDNDIVTR